MNSELELVGRDVDALLAVQPDCVICNSPATEIPKGFGYPIDHRDAAGRPDAR